MLAMRTAANNTQAGAKKSLVSNGSISCQIRLPEKNKIRDLFDLQIISFGGS
jgi:FMN phosphatase YigB (HAD superfamily)